VKAGNQDTVAADLVFLNSSHHLHEKGYVIKIVEPKNVNEKRAAESDRHNAALSPAPELAQPIAPGSAEDDGASKNQRASFLNFYSWSL